MRPARGRRVRMIPASRAPTAGALRRIPSPTGPVWRICLANSGSSATAPPNRTANRSSVIAPSITGVRRMNRTPPRNVDQLGAEPSRSVRGSWISSTSTVPTAMSTVATM